MANDQGAKKASAVLRVIAKREGFRRAGFQFGGEPTDIAIDSLKPSQIDALKSDPMLVVTEIEGKAEKAAA